MAYEGYLKEGTELTLRSDLLHILRNESSCQIILE